MNSFHYLLMIAVMTGVTVVLRFLPFAVFGGGKQTPAYISYLGKVLPYAIMGMLVVFCLKGTSIIESPHGIPELIACGLVITLQVWKRNTLISIICGTVCYMVLIQFIFV